MPQRPSELPVTALIPTFNRARLLREAIESILAGPQIPAQILVVDDGSDDDTKAVVDGFGGRVDYLRQENAGKSAALNHGLRKAAQPYIWIFDDDDIAEPGALHSLYEALERDPDAGFAYGACTKFFGEWPAEKIEDGFTVTADDPHVLYLRMLEDFFVWQGAMLVRRSCFEAVGPFDVDLPRSQDYDMAIRLLRRFRGVGLPVVIFHQRHHSGERGPRSSRIGSQRVNEAWRRFNQVILSAVYHNHDLAEFCIGADRSLTSRQRITALLQRAALMARGGLWYLAMEDMRIAAIEANDHPFAELNAQETNALRRVFERGSRSWFEEGSEARQFAKLLNNFPPAVRSEMAGNLLLPVSYSLRRAFRDGATMREWIHLLRILRSFLSFSSISAYRRARGRPGGMPGVVTRKATLTRAATNDAPAC